MASNWINTSNVVANDNTYSTNTIDGSGVTNNLFVYGFNLNLPATAIIEGFQVSVKRHATGTVRDYYVGLFYNSTSYTNPGKQLGSNWPSTETSVVYGGTTDTWGRSWTAAEVNDPNFGFVLSAVGNPFDVAYIDYIQLSVSYHQIINIYGSDGGYVSASGTATTTQRYNQTTTPSFGAKLDGQSVITISPTITPYGVIGDGTADISMATAVGDGIGIANGSADVFTIFESVLDPTEFSFNCLGSKNVPPDYSNSFSASCRLRVDTTNNILYWHIEHDVPDLDAARFRGPATETTPTAPTQIGIDGIEPLTSPVDGSASITPTQKAQILAGQWFLFLRRDSRTVGDPVIRLRSQIFNENTEVGGTASSTHTITESMNDGIAASGSARAVVTYSTTEAPSGAIDAGDALVAFSVAVGGGSEIGGSADYHQVFNVEVSGGVGINGSTTIVANYSIVIDPSGLLIDAAGIIGIQPSIGGGAGCDGHVQELKLAIPAIGGGAEVSGTYVLQQTYAAQPISGGLNTGAKTRARVELTKQLIRQNIKICGSLVTPNICNTPTDTKNKLIDPIGTVTPELSPSAFRMRHTPGWCDFGENCDGGYVPKIVAKRQGIYMPPKKGSTLPKPTDQLATMS